VGISERELNNTVIEGRNPHGRVNGIDEERGGERRFSSSEVAYAITKELAFVLKKC